MVLTKFEAKKKIFPMYKIEIRLHWWISWSWAGQSGRWGRSGSTCTNKGLKTTHLPWKILKAWSIARSKAIKQGLKCYFLRCFLICLPVHCCDEKLYKFWFTFLVIFLRKIRKKMFWIIFDGLVVERRNYLYNAVGLNHRKANACQ